jgi:isopentenyldiphosphate isomerase
MEDVYNPSEELIQIVTENNEELGVVTRGIMREQNLIHRASYILVFNRSDELLIQQRTDCKDIYPGFWDVAAGGIVLSGESYEESAKRELGEELGISARLIPCFDHFHQGPDNQVWGRVFRCRHEGPFHLQPEEINAVRFLPVATVLEMSESHDFTPDGIIILKRLLQENGEVTLSR